MATNPDLLNDQVVEVVLKGDSDTGESKVLEATDHANQRRSSESELDDSDSKKLRFVESFKEVSIADIPFHEENCITIEKTLEMMQIIKDGPDPWNAKRYLESIEYCKVAHYYFPSIIESQFDGSSTMDIKLHTNFNIFYALLEHIPELEAILNANITFNSIGDIYLDIVSALANRVGNRDKLYHSFDSWRNMAARRSDCTTYRYKLSKIQRLEIKLLTKKDGTFSDSEKVNEISDLLESQRDWSAVSKVIGLEDVFERVTTKTIQFQKIEIAIEFIQALIVEWGHSSRSQKVADCIIKSDLSSFFSNCPTASDRAQFLKLIRYLCEWRDTFPYLMTQQESLPSIMEILTSWVCSSELILDSTSRRNGAIVIASFCAIDDWNSEIRPLTMALITRLMFTLLNDITDTKKGKEKSDSTEKNAYLAKMQVLVIKALDNIAEHSDEYDKNKISKQLERAQADLVPEID